MDMSVCTPLFHSSRRRLWKGYAAHQPLLISGATRRRKDVAVLPSGRYLFLCFLLLAFFIGLGSLEVVALPVQYPSPYRRSFLL